MRRLILLSLATFVIALTPKAFANQGQAVMPQLVENELRRYIIQRFGWKTEKFELRVLGLPTVSLPIGPLQLRVLRAPASLTPGQQIFQIGAEIAGKEEANFTVRSEIKTFEDVVVAFRPLAFQEVVSAEAVRLERRELTSAQQRPFVSLNDVIGKQTTRAIAASELLSQGALDRPLMMRRGSAITLVYENVGLHIEAPGLADEGGKTGDFIQVRNPSSGKVLRGRVIDERTVLVN
jgi:flagella basal body P-ring formation protein FlgA